MSFAQWVAQWEMTVSHKSVSERQTFRTMERHRDKPAGPLNLSSFIYEKYTMRNKIIYKWLTAPGATLPD
jgi:hypothetical protein